MSIPLNENIHPSCASLLKEIQVFHNASNTFPYTLPCSNDVNNQSGCSASFSVSSQFDFCQSHPVQLRLVYKDEVLSGLLNSTIERAETPMTLDWDVVTVVGNMNEDALTIKWDDPGCFLIPIEAWRVVIKPSLITSNITSSSLKSGGIIFNEVLPTSCVIDGKYAEEEWKNIRYSLLLFKNQSFQCPQSNFTARTLDYDPCSNYSIDLLPKTEDSFQQKYAVAGNFTTPLDSSGIVYYIFLNNTFHNVIFYL